MCFPVGITGHRPPKVGGYRAGNPTEVWVREQIRTHLQQIQTQHPEGVCLYTGMALGVDQWAAEEAVALGIPFVAVLPFEGQDRQWPYPSRAKYQHLRAKAQQVVVVSEGGYTPEAMQTRDEWIVEHVPILIAVWDGSGGGTRNCVQYGKEQEVPIIRINPKNYRA